LTAIQEGIAACERCPRLRRYCERVAAEKKRAYREETYWGRPVPGFGDPAAKLFVVGLAPAAHGGNRTGRVFTGDSSGDFLFRALHKAGFANIPTSTHLEDGLRLTDAYIAAAVRCAPPDNKPTPAEIARCLPWLGAEYDALPRVRVIVALGRIGFDAVLRLLADRGLAARPRPQFGHGAVHHLPAPFPVLIASYHPSRQNTNTGRLTEAMFDGVFTAARDVIEGFGSQDSGFGDTRVPLPR
jgi:uracil-DNA glycosylase family 4